ncbi:3-hydroxyanthranilate 3,4-dioxygenase-like [Penaeus monodon]|uniref:3-hydroxyanthranilate 3,4-dioxygenase-like n=1 Tax=Penaeus monodon TaxID=6687 RepID=UPI0018A7DF9A|nr:3-hydroxyanthranilate 3,4-dioxygenase-like [Penaeus monodon]
MAPSTHVLHAIPTWIEENKKFFLPPVCNKMMHGDGQLKVFYVGGPNQRKDFHIEEGEEFFYMAKGDMNLITLTNGAFKDVIIKEGEVFLLPGKIPHSPQRFAETIGLVIERERMKTELDGLRYYVEGTTESLFERWFYCEDLGTQLGPIIKEYFASEQHKTGKPIPGTIPENPPFLPDAARKLEDPFPLAKWLTKHSAEVFFFFPLSLSFSFSFLFLFLFLFLLLISLKLTAISLFFTGVAALRAQRCDCIADERELKKQNGLVNHYEQRCKNAVPLSVSQKDNLKTPPDPQISESMTFREDLGEHGGIFLV